MPAVSRKRLRVDVVDESPLPPAVKQSRTSGTLPPRPPDSLILMASSFTSGDQSRLQSSLLPGLLRLLVPNCARHVRCCMAAVDSRFDELAARIDLLAASKAAALERELVTVDAALERWRADSGAVLEAVSSMPDADLALQYASLLSRLDDMEALLQALPIAVVEPPVVGLQIDASALLLSIAGFGSVLAPLSITAADLSLNDLPSRVRPGDTIFLRLSLGARHAAQSDDELEVSLGWLAGATNVEATVEGPGVNPRPLQASFLPDEALRSLLVCIEVPPAVLYGTTINVAAVSVAGQLVCGLPLSRLVRECMLIPMRLECDRFWLVVTPCISPEGLLYCPPGNGHSVKVFDAGGKPLPDYPASSLGLSPHIFSATYADGEVRTLLLADGLPGSSALAAVDPATRTVRWKSAVGDFHKCRGIAALPSQNVAILMCSGSLFAHRLSDGICVGSLETSENAMFLAADVATGALYGSITSGLGGMVHAWACATDGAGGLRISLAGHVAATGLWAYNRPLAVMPPAPGKTVSHLVVSMSNVTAYSNELLILSLPGLTLVHTQRLEGVVVMGLAADPWGGALAVCDMRSSGVRVVAWPLSGMPPLD